MKREIKEGEDFFLKRSGKFLLKLFFAVLLLKVFIYFDRLSNPSSFPGIDIRVNVALILTLVLAVLFMWPYKRTVLSLKDFFSELEGKSEEEYIKIAINYIFQISLVACLILLLINEFRTTNFNLKYLLVVVVLLGLLTLFLSHNEKTEDKSRLKKSSTWFMFLLAVLGSVLVFLKTKQLGWLSYPIALIAGILIFLLAYLIWKEEEEF